MITNGFRAVDTLHANLRADMVRELQIVHNHMVKIYQQPPNCATVDQRRAARARQGMGERVDERGRTTVFRFAEPTDQRPPRLDACLKNCGEFWQEWKCGIAGNLPARLWNKEQTSARNNKVFACKYSRRKPIYLMLQRLIVDKGHIEAEAFRLMEKHFPSRMGVLKIGKEIRHREENCTMHPELCDGNRKLDLVKSRKRKRVPAN